LTRLCAWLSGTAGCLPGSRAGGRAPGQDRGVGGWFCRFPSGWGLGLVASGAVLSGDLLGLGGAVPDGFQVESGLLRSAAGSVEECCSLIESGRKSGAAATVGSSLAGFAVVGACSSAAEASLSAFTAVAKSWRAWSVAADRGASDYSRSDLGGESLIRGAGADLVV
jgi:hypothetical protein